MADGEEKTLPATPKKRAEARKQGQVARSAEFGAAATLLALMLVLHATLPGEAGQSLVRDMRGALAFSPHDSAFGFGTVARWQTTGLLWAARLVVPTLALAVMMGLAVNIGQVGLQITPEALAPKFERLNPVAGFQRLLSTRGAVELVKGLLKMAIIAQICWATLSQAVQSGDILRTMRMPLSDTLTTVGGLLWTLGLRVSVALLLLAVADFAYQKFQFEKTLKMSLSEVKQESRQSEGSPETKQRVRRMQREMAKKRMMTDVPKADVVVTNPTHFAVALQYEDGAPAPKVVAKGQDEMARLIRELAQEHHIPLVENKPLARTLYATVEVGRLVPPDLYEAVAQVLAFVYRTHGRRARR